MLSDNIHSDGYLVVGVTPIDFLLHSHGLEDSKYMKQVSDANYQPSRYEKTRRDLLQSTVIMMNAVLPTQEFLDKHESNSGGRDASNIVRQDVCCGLYHLALHHPLHHIHRICGKRCKGSTEPHSPTQFHPWRNQWSFRC